MMAKNIQIRVGLQDCLCDGQRFADVALAVLLGSDLVLGISFSQGGHEAIYPLYAGFSVGSVQDGDLGATGELGGYVLTHEVTGLPVVGHQNAVHQILVRYVGVEVDDGDARCLEHVQGWTDTFESTGQEQVDTLIDHVFDLLDLCSHILPGTEIRVSPLASTLSDLVFNGDKERIIHGHASVAEFVPGCEGQSRRPEP